MSDCLMLAFNSFHRFEFSSGLLDPCYYAFLIKFQVCTDSNFQDKHEGS